MSDRITTIVILSRSYSIMLQVVSCRLSIRCAILNHSATICDRMSQTLKSWNQQGVGSLWAKISGCSPWRRHL